MKKNTYFSILILAVLVGFISCDTVNKYTMRLAVDREPVESISNVVPNHILETVKNLGLEIYNGKNPPNIEGTYFIAYLQLVKNNTRTNIAEQWEKYVTFSRQNNALQSINADYTMQTSHNYPMSSKGPGAFVFGEDNKFTVVVLGTREQGRYTAETIEFYSGEISSDGIINYQWAVSMVDDKGDPLNIWIENGDSYLKRDREGFSPRVR